MSIPKIPTFKKPDKHQLKGVLQRRIRQLIVKLRDTLPKTMNTEMMMRYHGVICPGSHKDITRLPFDTVNGTTKDESITSCLYAKLSFLILRYWDYYLDETDNAADIHTLIGELERIATIGLNYYEVAGDVKNGFRLEERKS